MNESLNETQQEQICTALERGQKIEAIKIYRDATGASLKTAKDFIDGLQSELIKQDPDRYAKASSGGCGAAAMLVLAFPAVLAVSYCFG